MANFNLMIGNKVDVARIKKTKNNDPFPILSSKVVDILDDKTIVMNMPMEKTVTIPLEINETVELYFYTDLCILSATAVAKDRYFEGSLPVVKMELTSSLEKLQRRQYYRIECYLPCKFYIMTEKEMAEILRFKAKDRVTAKNLQEHINELTENVESWNDDIIIDLSGGGVRFVTGTEIPKGSAFLLSMKIANGEETSNFVTMARLVSLEHKRETFGKVEVRAKFYKIQDTLRDSIVRFVFDEERRIRNKSNYLE